MEKIYFQETQRIDQKWLWVIIFVLLATPLALAIFVKEGVIISTLIAVPIVALLLLLRLKTKISNKGIYVKFFPIFVLDKLISWSDIDQISLRKYKAITEYGGWGLRISYKNGLAYTIRGKWGIQIHLKNGKSLLIGTQEPDTIKQILASELSHIINQEID